MRLRGFVMCALLLAVPMLLAAQEPAYDDMCITGEGGGSTRWQVEAVWIGRVDCSLLNAAPDGGCTAVQYTVGTNDKSTGNKNISHAAVLVYNPPPYPAIDDGWTSAGSNSVYARCVGDSATDTGIGSCHEQVVRVNANGDKTATWWVAVDGVRQQSTTTVAIKGQSEGRCTILGVGDEVEDNSLPPGCVPSCGDFDDDQSLIKTEIIDFEGCKARFDWNLEDGSLFEFGAACDPKFIGLTQAANDLCCDQYPDDPNCDGGDCEFPAYYDLDDPQQLPIIVALPDGTGVPLRFGDGLITIGTGTCSCRVIGGRVYCWGRPCPQ